MKDNFAIYFAKDIWEWIEIANVVPVRIGEEKTANSLSPMQVKNEFAASFDSGHEEQTANGGASHPAVLLHPILLFRQFVFCVPSFKTKPSTPLQIYIDIVSGPKVHQWLGRFISNSPLELRFSLSFERPHGWLVVLSSSIIIPTARNNGQNNFINHLLLENLCQ